ncbi:hypothetical protein FB45DRAFT_10612 [Roridomyces roridus]|uniref:Telomerase reverse transcriptase C-terminal extension domain-containing protein n=1 Tax=Roridomyces roridus TaxID=1738132 RepID=A0AAD7CL72_9AGAR|nr:hypothetical protein FB45DRAFT_10612 [Roridomyces roridus]
MNGYICEWGLDTRKSAAFLRDTVQQMISYSLVVIRNKASTRFSVSHGGKADVQKSAVTWLGMHAFHAIFSRRPARYAELLRMLNAYLAKPLNGRYARRFRRLTTEGLGDMTPIDPNSTI